MTRRHPLPFALRSLLFLVLCAFPFAVARGQASTATLSGEVVDQNGAVIPGALVKIINPATAFGRETTTSDSGAYAFPLLPPGTYQVTAQRDGFSPVRVEKIVLNVGDQKALQVQLKAGDVNATVTVQSDAETVRTDGSVGTVVNRQFVANIPLNGRSLHALLQLTPGVVLTPIPSGGGDAAGNGQFSVNGQRTTSNYFTVDGVSANTGMAAGGVGAFPFASGSGQTAGTTALGGTNSLVSLDALEEFRIETSTYAPEFGRTPGGQISLLTRGGTNQFHGSASYYFRNEALDANDWFANANRQPKPKERQNLFGGVLGGPIKKERLFFFGSYEGLRLQQPKVLVVTVPTVALRAQAVPALRPYLNALPLPNGRDLGNSQAEFAASYSDPGTFNVLALRFDGTIAKSLTGFFRVNYAPSETKTRTSSLSTVSSVRVVNQAYTGGLTWVAASRLTADLRLNWTRNAPRRFFDLEAFGGAVIPGVSDVFAPGRDPSHAASLFTAIGAFTWGPGTSDVQRQLNAVGTAAWLVGAHQLKFGLDYRRMLPLLGATGGDLETLFYSNATGIMANSASLYQLTTSDSVPREAIISNLSLFAQDTWRVNRRLTVTYGLRFERVPPPSEGTGRPPRTVLGIENAVLQNPRLAPEGTPLWRNRLGEFAPRFGVAYQLHERQGWETTLRGGAGIFDDLGLGTTANAFQIMWPYYAQKLLSNVPLPLSDSARTPPRLVIDPPQALFLFDPALRLPYTIEWNVTMDQRIDTAQVVKVAYVGAAGRRLLILEGYRQPLAEWPTTPFTISIERNLGSSRYDALQVQYERRLQRGLQALASYTLGRSRDNTSQDIRSAPPASHTGLLEQEFGPSDFDVRHLLSAAVTYDLPRLAGPRILEAVSRDWGLDLLIRYQSALPLSPTTGLLSLPDGTFFTARPNRIPGVPLYIKDPSAPGGRTFNNIIPTADQIASAGCVPLNASRTNAKGALCTPPTGQQGTFPRNGLRAFPSSQVDLALRREIRLGENVRLQLRGELFNLFNHPNFGTPTNSITSGLFGRPTSMLNQSLGGLNGLYQMGGPRSGELAVKVIW